MKKATILSIEDDQNLQTVIQLYLEDQGYGVLSSRNAQDCVEKIQSTHVDLILLDLGLPDADGLSLLSKIKQHSQAPIIVVSGKSDATDRILGLELGADDYLGKPFEMRELYARIKVALRRAQPQDGEGAEHGAGDLKEARRLAFGQWVLDRETFTVVDAAGESANLTMAEFKILEVLLNAHGRALSREQLSEIAMGHEYQSLDRGVDIHISRLRKKLGSADIIKTVRGVGYIFCEPVTAGAA